MVNCDKVLHTIQTTVTAPHNCPLPVHLQCVLVLHWPLKAYPASTVGDYQPSSPSSVLQMASVVPFQVSRRLDAPSPPILCFPCYQCLLLHVIETFHQAFTLPLTNPSTERLNVKH